MHILLLKSILCKSSCWNNEVLKFQCELLLDPDTNHIGWIPDKQIPLQRSVVAIPKRSVFLLPRQLCVRSAIN